MTTRISNLQLSGNVMLGRDTAVKMTWVSPQNRVLGAFRDGDSINILFKASGKNLTAPITYSVVVGSVPIGTTLNPTTGRLLGVAGDEDALYDFTIRAQSGSSFVDHQFRIVVGDHPSPIWITPAGLLTVGNYNDEVEMNLVLEAEDPYGLPVQYLINGGSLPPGVFLDVNTGVISGTYPILSEDQEFEFTVSATNGDTGTLRTFSIYVMGLPQAGAPIWITPPGDIGDPYELSYFAKTLKAIDLEGDEITYIRVAGNIPPFLTLDGNTGVLSGTLDAVPDNTQYKFIVGAKTPDLLVTKRMFTVTVRFDTPPSFDFVQNPHVYPNAFEDTSFFDDLSANSTSTPGLQRTYTSTNLPPGFTLDTTTGEIACANLPLVSDPDEVTEKLQWKVTISDGLKSTDHFFELEVQKDLPPIWIPTGNSLGEAYAETFFTSTTPLAFDFWGRPVVFALDVANTPMPGSMTFDNNTGEISGQLPPSPSNDIVYPATITATSGAHPVTKTWFFTAWKNEPPIWGTQGDLGEAIEDYPSPFAVYAFDSHMVQVVTYQLANGTSLPTGLTLDPNSGVISGTCPAVVNPDYDTYDFTVEASYQGILPSYQDFSIRILRDYPPVWDTPPGNLVTVLGLKDFSASLQAHDPNLTPITYSLIIDEVTANAADVVTNPNFATINGWFPLVNSSTTYTQQWGIDDTKNPVVTRDFTFTVLPNLPPVWNTVANSVVIDAFETETVNFQLDAYDPEGVPLTYYYTLSSNELIKTSNTVLSLTSNGAITGTLPPVTSDTEYTFSIKAWDNTADRNNNRLLVTPQTVRVMVRFNHPPAWQTAPNIFEIENHVFSMNLVATGSGNLPAIIYTLTNGSPPPGITFYSNGALIGETQEVSEDTDYTFTVSAYNGIKAAERTFTFTVFENRGPVWDTPAGEIVNTVANVGFTTQIVGHDPNQPFGELYMMLANGSAIPNGVAFEVDPNPPDLSNVYITGNISGKLPISETDEDYSFTAELWDGQSPPVPRTFTLHSIKNQDPVWNTPEGLLAVRREEKFVTLGVSATDPEGNAIVYTLANGTNLPGTLVLYQNGTIMGDTPNALVDANYPFQVKAEESPLHASYRDFSITITHNYPPTWDTPAGNIGTVLGGYDFENAIVATDQNLDDVLTYSLVGGSLPPGITLMPDGTFFGAMALIPANTDYTFTANATDGVYTISRQFMISGLLNHPPVFNPVTNTVLGTQREGTFFSTNILATDPDGVGISKHELADLPDGLNFNSATGDLEGTLPIYNANTQVEFTYTANDGVLESTAHYFINVLFDSPPTFITNSPLPVAVENQDYGTIITATANGQPVFYSIDSGFLPIGINLLSNGVIIGTAPSTDENQEYIFTVRAATDTKSTTKQFSLTVLKNIPPVWDTNAVLTPAVLETKFQSYTLTAHDENNLPISYSFQGGSLPMGWTFNPNGAGNTAIISGIAPSVNADTDYTFMIGASNGYIRTDRNFTLTVKDNLPPVWVTNSGVISNVIEQTVMPITSVTATDPEGNAVTYAMNTATHAWPGWLTLVQANGALYGTAPSVLTNTTVTFTIDASDSTLVNPRDFAINIIHDTARVDPYANTNMFHTHMDGNADDITRYPSRLILQNNSMGFDTSNKMFGNASAQAVGPNFLRYTYSDDFELNVPEWTVEFWGNPTANTGSQQGWLHLGGSGAFQGMWNVGISATGQWNFSAWLPSSTQTFAFGNAVLNTWQHVAVSRDNTGVIRGFVNGVQGGSFTANVASTTGTEDFYIGASNGGFMYGNIDEVRISRKGRYTTNFASSVPTSAFPMAPTWNTPANGTVIATGDEGNAVTSPTLVQGIDLNATGSMTYQITTASPFSYTTSGNSGLLQGTYPSLITDSNYPISTVVRDGAGNYSKPRMFFADVNAAKPNNLRFSWRFNRDIGSTDFKASVANGSTITTSTTPAQFLAGGAVMSYITAPSPHTTETTLQFGGTSSASVRSSMNYSTVGTDFQFLTGSFTVEMWVYPTILVGGSNHTLLQLRGNSFRILRLDAGDPSQRIVMLYNGTQINGPGTNGSAAANLVLNSWNHVAFTRNGTTATLYLNGSPGTPVATGTPVTTFFDNQVLIFNNALRAEDAGGTQWAWPNLGMRAVQFWDIVKYTGAFTPQWPGY
jgi:hypothetical protein